MSSPYPDYKDSGIEWIGAVPSHWQALPIRKVAKLESGHTPSRSHPEYWENCCVPWFTLADVWQIRDGRSSYVFDTKEKVSEVGLANSSARKLPAGTVMLSRTASVGYSAIMGVEMATTQDFANWVCGKRLDPQFLLYSLRAMAPEFTRLKMGSTHSTIYMPDIASLSITLPPIEEQRAITAFLECKTAKIDALVQEQTRLIALLKEKRQAVISRAVTKGLNPDASMKPSGIEWLGDVPAHWKVVPLKRRWSLTDCKHLTATFVPEGIPLASIREVQSKYVQLDEAKQTTEDFYEQLTSDGRLPKPGDLIFSRNATVGEVAQVAEYHPKFAMGQDVCLMRRLSEDQSPDFLQAYLKSSAASVQLELLMVGATFRRVNVESVRNIIVPSPPPQEQLAIVGFLDADVEQTGALITNAQAVISLLRERREALISAAVTGKFDVRDLASEETEAA